MQSALTICALSLSVESGCLSVPEHFLVTIETGSYRVYHVSGAKQMEIYSEPYDPNEVDGMQPVIAEIWPAPLGRGFAFLRVMESRRRTPENPSYRLALYNVDKKRRSSLFAEDSLPDMTILRQPGYLTWQTEDGARFGTVMASDPGRDQIKIVDAPLHQDYAWDVFRKCKDWSEFLDVVKPQGKARETKHFKRDSFEFDHDGKTIRWDRERNCVGMVEDGAIQSHLWDLPSGETPYSFYFDGYTQLAVVTARRTRHRGYASDSGEWAADFAFTTYVLDIVLEREVAVYPNAYLYRAVPLLGVHK